MPIGEAYHYLLGPLIAFAVVGVLILLSRWAFTPGSSLVGARGPSRTRDFGLLVPVATVHGAPAADTLRRVLSAHGIRGTVARADSDPDDDRVHVLVFVADAARARSLVQTPN